MPDTGSSVALTESRRLTVSPALQALESPTSVATPTTSVPWLNCCESSGFAPPVADQCSPRSRLTNTPWPAIETYMTLGSVGSPARSSASPNGKPKIWELPDMRGNVAPVSLLRKTPPVVPTKTAFAATTITFPRGATPVTLNPASSVVPRPVHESPPFVERYRPIRSLPTEPKLLVRPTPATRTAFVPPAFGVTVGSSASTPIDIAGP